MSQGSSCDGGLSIDVNLGLNVGGDTGGIDLGQILFPTRLARQILSGTSQARPKLGGVVLAQPGVQLQGASQTRPNFGGVVLAQSGVPFQTAPPTGQHSVQVSTTSHTNVRLCLKTIVTFLMRQQAKRNKNYHKLEKSSSKCRCTDDTRFLYYLALMFLFGAGVNIGSTAVKSKRREQ